MQLVKKVPLSKSGENISVNGGRVDVSVIVKDCIASVLDKKGGVWVGVGLGGFSEDASFSEIGVDSLGLTEISSKLGQQLGVDIDETAFFQYSTPSAMSDYLSSKISPDDVNPCDASDSSDTAAAVDVQSIAVIGVACRFPGNVNTAEDFLTLLKNGVDAITDVPKSRWDAESYYNQGKIISKCGGFIDGADMFDADFFNISPREAARMDPQQALLLETTWEALETAAIVPGMLTGTRTGVFVGAFTNNFKHSDADDLDMYYATGNSVSMLAGRISYVFGLKGPSMAIDTACSSSLVAVHLAARSIIDGESDMALALGVNLILSPELTIAFSNAGMLAPDGRCKTFDASADGYVRAEGCAAIVLKPLSKAIADGNQVLAVIRGTAVNQDGASNGLTAPDIGAQESVIRNALRKAGVAPHDVSYVEAHGTGTPLGDPIEIKAIENVYGKGRGDDNPLVIGSVKTNIGHAEAASGIAGLIKVVLSLKYGFIPQHLHFSAPNPNIHLHKIPAVIPVKEIPWERADTKRRIAGVSSFGFSGTNAHVIVEEAPPILSSSNVVKPYNLLILSAITDTALKETAERYASYINSHPEIPIEDICYTANTGRTIFGKRAAILADSGKSLTEKLIAYKNGEERSGVLTERKLIDNPAAAFLFTGQGSQYKDMGRMLYESEPVFRDTLNTCSEILSERLNPTIVELLYGKDIDSALLDETIFTQPVIFAVEYALCELWKSWGVNPACVMGHSVGEYVAACVAGVFSLEDALKLISVRGALMQKISKPGAMAAVFADEITVLGFIEKYADSVSLAALNGADNTVISGKKETVDALCQTFEQNSIPTRNLKVSHAFHSPLMAAMLEEFRSVLQTVSFSKPKINIISNVTGDFITDEITTPDYWINHVMKPVRFADGMRAIADASYKLFLEIGAKPILTGMAMRTLKGDDYIWCPSLKEGKHDIQVMTESLGTMSLCGVDVNFESFYHNAKKVMLPTYPFQRRQYAINYEPAVRITDDSWKQLLYNVVWQKSDSHQFSLDKIELPDIGAKKYGKLVSELEKLSLEFIIDALRKLNYSFREEGFFTIDELANRLGITERHKRLLNRLFEIIEEEGIVVNKNGAWANKAVPDSVNCLSHAKAIGEAYTAAENELSILTLCGASLSEVLIGKTDPLHLLFPDADTSKISGLYQNSPTFGQLNTLLTHFVSKLLSHGTDISVLEIGAGTGGTTAHLLPALPSDLSKYMFTDVGALFINKARQRFSEKYPFMQYRVLDMEKPIESQGFAGEKYNIIVAANVLHATRNLRTTLERIKAMLSPGGILIAVEGVAKRRWIDLIFGLIEGWWRFDDFDLRPSHPLISKEQWETTLIECGFKDAATYAAVDDEAEELFPQRLVVAVNDDYILDNHSVMILGDSSGVSVELATALNSKNVSTIMVTCGETYEKHNDTLYTINYEDVDNFKTLIQDVKSSGVTLKSIVHTWSIGLNLTEDMTMSDINRTISRSCLSALNLLKALVSEGGNDYPRLMFVTDGAQAVDDITPSVLHPAQSALWGLVRTMASEHPEFHPKLIDLEPGNHSADILLNELIDVSAESAVAYRNSERYLPRLKESHNPIEEPLSFEPSGTYLITGGTGGIGLTLAKWMAQQGAGEIILTSRSAPNPQTLAELGHKVRHVRTDVSKLEELRSLFDKIEHSGAKMKGVIHAAGVFDDQLLINHRWELFEKVFAPKITGAWNLHCLTKNMNLDFFVLFSSVTSIINTSGVANYAAANAFMDTMAHRRRSMGLCALSINWGPWTDTGMAQAVSDRSSKQWSADGIETISPHDAINILKHHLNYSGAGICAAKIDWMRFSKKLSNVEVKTETAVAITEKLKLSEPSKRRELITDYVTHVAAAVLGFDDTKIIDSTKGFFQMGMDSLTSVELRNRLQADLNIPLSTTFTFKYPNIDAVTDYLLNVLFKDDSTVKLTEILHEIHIPLKDDKPEPIAIVGMGCRFPGGCDSIDAYWRFLRDGGDGIVEIPSYKWPIYEHYNVDRNAPGKIYITRGGFLTDIDQFDAAFFRISPREAVSLDPQQRLLLEVAWEALENAAIAPDSLYGSDTGVFIGIGQNDYARRGLTSGDLSRINTYDGTGNLLCFASGRLSYVLGLHGPAVSIDTACSSSLVAIHMACTALRQRECSMALAGGVHLVLSPEMTIFLSRANVLSPDGRCKTFDAQADGFSRGEGCGIIALKRLSDAISDGDNVLALIRGSAVNQDGSGSGLTVPNEAAQERVIRSAILNGGVEPSEVSFIEAHGTGTALGDPIEVGALGAVFKPVKSKSNPLVIGSVKTNFGHLEAAAGVAGLIKVVLSMVHSKIPPHLHFKTPNPHIDWDSLPIEVASDGRTWSGKKIAGVSSFGFSGTNAHIVLEEAPLSQSVTSELKRPLHILTLSAKTDEALIELTTRYRAMLLTSSDIEVSDLCYTTNVGRTHFAMRKFVIGKTTEEFLKGLAGTRDFQLSEETVESDLRHTLINLGELYVSGKDVDWRSFHAPYSYRKLTTLPTYPFERKSYWLDTSEVTEKWKTPGERIRLPMSKEVRFESLFSAHSPSYISDHRVFDRLVVAGASHLSMVLQGLMEAYGFNSCMIYDVFFSAPLVIDETQSRLVQLIIEPHENNTYLFKLISQNEKDSNDSWVTHVTGKAAPLRGHLSEFNIKIEEIRLRCPNVTDGDNFYDKLQKAGFDLGQTFRWNSEIWSNKDEVLCAIKDASSYDRQYEQYQLYPGLMDSAFQLLSNFWNTAHGESEGESFLYVPFRIPDISFYSKPNPDDKLLCYAAVTGKNDDESKFPPTKLLIMTTSGKLIALINGFEFRKADTKTLFKAKADSTNIRNDWLYEIKWIETELKTVIQNRLDRRHFLIFANDSDFITALSDMLRKLEATVSLVSNIEKQEDYIELINGIVNITDVLFFAGIDINAVFDIERAQTDGVISLAYLVSALLKSNLPKTPHLYVITRGAQFVNEIFSENALRFSTIWGMAHVIDLEAPALRAQFIDLDPVIRDSEISDLFYHITNDTAESQVSFRGGVRYAARISKTKAISCALKLDGNSSYVITGGLGALGMELSMWLAEKGAHHIALIGRHEAGLEARKKISQLETQGVSVKVISADVSVKEDVERLFGTIAETMPPVRGIIHAAGVLDDSVILNLNAEKFRNVMKPKVYGSWNLHNKTIDMNLDFFVCFSSLAAMTGSKGQGNYAAANAFMDALIRYRRSSGLTGLSVNWGAWGDVGMASRLSDVEKARLLQRGVGTISLNDGFKLLEDLITEGATNVGVFPVNWSKYETEVYSGKMPPFFELVKISDVVKPSANVISLSSEELNKLPLEEHRQQITNHIRGHVASVLGMKSPQDIGLRVRLFDAGIDSLMAIELKNRLETGFKLSLPATIVFDYPTVEALTEYICRELGILKQPDTVDSESSKDIELDSLLDDIDTMSDEELMRKFKK
ncbi:SDR family NAD(P)-dependent oxidoreductase [Candidatus Magnetomonas plexicatena]|uniref:SDR family NAD(P)-dependent oxidoreductase n=1 Tax=Candidatus Magnetomonas plexicatena TaxID=2552947 RepID=UPI001C7610C2|nr:SDR family NAD(P)-dependent oxidoreductase [Nitrospirales bacterium LBB_01]